MRCLPAAVLSLASLMICATPRAAADEPADTPPTALERHRAAFIENFDWIQLNSTPGDATMLRILVESSKAKRGVEVGTATGYGAIVMGMGFERNGGELITVDIDPKMVAKARENLAQVKLEETVTVVEGDAMKVLPELEGTFDFVYLDAMKSQYLGYFEALEPKLTPGAVIVADNVVRSARAMADFLERIDNDPNYLSVTIRASDMKNDGMLVVYKLK